nr:hypothetical protein [Acidobacteriota bacterium]
VVVDGDDIPDVAVPIGPGTTIRGRVEVEGASVNATPVGPLRLVTWRAAFGMLPGGTVEVDVPPDLTFTLAGIHGRQQLRVMELPDGWWVKSITIEGRDALAGYDFPRRGTLDNVVVLVSARPSGVTGRVEGTPDALRGAVVAAIPDDSTDSPEDIDVRTQLRPLHADGSFALRGLRPGRYMIAALAVGAMDARRDQTREEQGEFLRSVGTAIDVSEGRVETATLRLVDVPAP